MGVDRAAKMTLVFCILHNFCEIRSENVPLCADVEHCRDSYVDLRRGAVRLTSDGQAEKVAGEMMRATFFQACV
jgi:hypothetical protein